MTREQQAKCLGRAAYIVNAFAFKSVCNERADNADPPVSHPRAKAIEALTAMSRELEIDLVVVPVRTRVTPMRAIDEVLDVVSNCVDTGIDVKSVIQSAREFIDAAENLHEAGNRVIV